MDVALAMLEVEGAQAGVPRASTKAIRHVLRQERRRRLRALKDGTGPKAVAKLRARVRNAIHGRHVEAGDVVLERRNAWRYAGELASGLEDHLGRAGRRFSPARLHGVRIATKKLRYALEVVDALEPAGRVKGMQTLRTVQRQLGRLHDVDLLRRRTRDILKTAGALDERGAGGLDRLERHLDDEARRAHASYLESAEALGVVCEQAKEGAARQTDSGY
jgi:CHAD domain-containing protein